MSAGVRYYARTQQVIKAWRFDGRDWGALKQFCPKAEFPKRGERIFIPFAIGKKLLQKGDWVVKWGKNYNVVSNENFENAKYLLTL